MAPTSRPAWFAEFLADRGTRKPSPHTLAAYCRDFDTIAAIITGGPDVSGLALDELNRDALRTAFSVFAATHAAASIRRAWSTWNTLCEFLYSSELIPANPMATVARPKTDKTLAKALPPNTIDALLAVLDADAGQDGRRDAWAIRDRAMILTALLTGLRLAELVGLNIGDIRTVESGAVLHVRGKGGKDRRVPIEPPLLAVLEDYLASRALRFGAPRGHSRAGGLAGWPAAAPLFVDAADGSRITRRTLQYRVLRAFRRAGIDAERQRGALVHGLRHTFATDLANADVNVYELKNLLGHASLATSQRYIDGAGQETRAAAARNPLYDRLYGAPGRRRI